MRPLSLALFVALLAACSSAAPSSPKPDRVDYHFAFKTDAGTETYWCQYAKMPDAPANAAGFEWHTTHAHHWALFRTVGLDTSAVDGKPFPCFGDPRTKAAEPASVVSQPTTNITSLTYPSPYAVPFAGSEVVLVQLHSVNTSLDVVAPTLDLTILLADPGEAVTELRQLQMYDPFIDVPALGVGHASMQCAVPFALDIVQLATHTHTRGTSVRVFLDPPAGPSSTTPLLETTDWQDPDSMLGVLHVEAGSKFRTYCDYHDTEGQETFQGPTRDRNEMCEPFGFYAASPLPDPAVFFEACVPKFLNPAGTGDMFGTGTSTCGVTLACISACPAADAPVIADGQFRVGGCWQKCVVDSCPSASAQMAPAFQCLSSKCQVECAAGTGDPACQACVASRCLAEVSACQSAVCAAP